MKRKLVAALRVDGKDKPVSDEDALALALFFEAAFRGCPPKDKEQKRAA